MLSNSEINSECPVCYNKLGNDMTPLNYCCHLLCRTCYDKINQTTKICPLCRVSFSKPIISEMQKIVGKSIRCSNYFMMRTSNSFIWNIQKIDALILSIDIVFRHNGMCSDILDVNGLILILSKNGCLIFSGEYIDFKTLFHHIKDHLNKTELKIEFKPNFDYCKSKNINILSEYSVITKISTLCDVEY